MPTRPPTYGQRQAALSPPKRQPAEKRLSASAQGYGHEWRKLRLMVLRSQPICAHCRRAPARQVDHILAKAKGGDDSAANLQGLCARCHSVKSVREDGALGKGSREGTRAAKMKKYIGGVGLNLLQRTHMERSVKPSNFFHGFLNFGKYGETRR